MIATKLKPYMLFSRSTGACEGAYLVFALTAQQAKSVGNDGQLTDEYIDLGVQLIRDGEHLYREGNREKLLENIPHYIDNPVVCKGCLLWGEPFNNEGWCQSCWEEYSDKEWEASHE